ncbi:MarR family winged helix-turn-helix transcriptional regulator [Cellulomonas massiliensis]|uniref:MarR family winged helix-turn-helix transcriptional regulator n=1 Tax=Cellulomonas massiliensis TaxID=1465811 RepID=UPI00036688AC|nr:MarR family winged helix-turn-helix transcriptional regulator [Cellulomonas massiliensis]
MSEGPSYWYADDPSVTDVLEAVRRLRRADEAMRRRTSAGMGMNVRDLAALQVVVAGERAGRAVHPHDVAHRLGITTASTVKLVDRLVAAGHLRREQDPDDRRAVRLVATPHAHDEIRERLTPMHAGMADAARAVPAEARRPLVAYLHALADVFDDVAVPEPGRPAPQGPLQDGPAGERPERERAWRDR